MALFDSKLSPVESLVHPPMVTLPSVVISKCSAIISMVKRRERQGQRKAFNIGMAHNQNETQVTWANVQTTFLVLNVYTNAKND